MNNLELNRANTYFAYIPGETEKGRVTQISYVLTSIFGHLPFSDLRQTRQVCRSWHHVVCQDSRFSDQSVMVLRGSPDSALTFLRSREYKSWKHFRFITPLLDNSTQIQASFWITLGHNILSLSLLAHSLSPVEFLNVLSACPSMRSLTFSCRHLWTDYADSFQPSTATVRLIDNVGFYRQQRLLFDLTSLTITDSNLLPQGVLRDLLMLAINIEDFCLYDTSPVTLPMWDVGDIIRFVTNAPKQVKRLELTGSNIYPEYITALAGIADLDLTTLHLRYAKLTDTSLLGLFKKHKSLTEIDLSFTQCSQRAFLHVHCSFANLKRLRLRGFSSNITTFAFLARMPNLEELDLSATFSTSMNWEQFIDFFLPLRLQKLKSVNLSFNMGLGIFPRARLFTSLITSLNQVTCLNLSQNSFVKDAFIHDIWRYMNNLRVVFLEYLCGMSTEGITGIRHSQMQNMLANGTLGRIDPALLRHQNSVGSYIGIEILSLAYNSRLNDFIIPFGITDLENLQKLKLTGCSQISETYFVDLITYCTRLEYLDLTGTQISSEWANWAKRTNPKLRRVEVSDIWDVPAHASQFNQIGIDGDYVLNRISSSDSMLDPSGQVPVELILKKQFDCSDIEELHVPGARGDLPILNSNR